MGKEYQKGAKMPLDLMKECAQALHDRGQFYLNHGVSDHTRQKGKDMQKRAEELFAWVEAHWHDLDEEPAKGKD